jgi:hypothetical protein
MSPLTIDANPASNASEARGTTTRFAATAPRVSNRKYSTPATKLTGAVARPIASDPATPRAVAAPARCAQFHDSGGRSAPGRIRSCHASDSGRPRQSEEYSQAEAYLCLQKSTKSYTRQTQERRNTHTQRQSY